MKPCTKCGTVLPLVAFCADKARTDGLQRWCRDCQREYRKANRKRLSDYDRAYRESRKPTPPPVPVRGSDKCTERCLKCHRPTRREDLITRRGTRVPICKTCSVDMGNRHPKRTEKKCSACQQIKPVAAFFTDRHAKSGLYAYCKPCASERRKRRA